MALCPQSLYDEELPATTCFFSTRGPVPAVLALERLTFPPSCWSLGHPVSCCPGCTEGLFSLLHYIQSFTFLVFGHSLWSSGNSWKSHVGCQVLSWVGRLQG